MVLQKETNTRIYQILMLKIVSKFKILIDLLFIILFYSSFFLLLLVAFAVII